MLAEEGNRITYELNVDWESSLKSSVDSSGSAVLSLVSVNAAVRGVYEAAQMLRLPALTLPQVRLLASDFDEISLPAAAKDSALVRQLSGDIVYATELGVYRKSPVATLYAQLLRYDPTQNTLRRYRRMVVQVTTSGVARAEHTLSRASQQENNPHLAVSQSVLADGQVMKFPVTQAGVYRMDRAFLSDAGLNPDTIEPNNLQLLGNGGKPLPALNGDDRPADLVENPVFVRGGGDGAFNDGDVLIFYGAAPTGWTFDTEQQQWDHYVNPFSVQNFYFLKVGAEAGLRVEKPAFPNYANPDTYNAVTGRLFVDFDQFIWSKQNGSGLSWVSNPIDPTLDMRGLSATRQNGLTIPSNRQMTT